ncbi:MAG: LamG-like jellyroll fold domain-containing protein, partial [Verrucomicrobiales bacterium]
MKTAHLLCFVLAMAAVSPALGRGHANFDGTTAATAVVAPNIANSSFTIEFWIQRDAARRVEWALGQGDPIANNGLHIGYRGDGRFSFAFWSNDLNVQTGNERGQWVHWACVYDADTNQRRIHRNGVEVAVATDTASADYAGSGPLSIGGRPQPDGANFIGKMDNLRIWSSARTGAQINASFNRETLSGADLLLDLPLDSDAGLNPGSPLTYTAWQPAYELGEIPVNTIAVTTLAADGPGSLQAALTQIFAIHRKAELANPGQPLPLLEIDCTEIPEGTINVTSAFELSGRTILQGPGKGRLTLDGGGISRAIVVDEGSTVVIRDLTIANCYTNGIFFGSGAGGGPGLGGGLVAGFGTDVRIERVDFLNNTAEGSQDSGLVGQAVDPEADVDPSLFETPGRGGAGGNDFGNIGTTPSGDGTKSSDGVVGGARGVEQTILTSTPGAAPSGSPGNNGPTGEHAVVFRGGGRGSTGSGGGGGAYPVGFNSRGGNGGRGGDGGAGGIGGYGAGGGSGGGAGGPGGGGIRPPTNTNPSGARGGAGGGGAGGAGGFGGAAGTAGGPSTNHPDLIDIALYPGFGGDNGRSGAGAGMGGAVFIAAHSTLALYDVHFCGNSAIAGVSAFTNPNKAQAIGAAVHLMHGATLVATQRVTHIGNTESPARSADPFYGFPINFTYQILSGNFEGGGDPLYYYAAERLAPGTHATFRYRWMLYETDGSAPYFAYTIDSPSGGAPQDADPEPLFTAADRENASRIRQALFNQIQQGDLEAENALLDIAYDTATFDAFIAGFRASQIERDARILEPAFPYTLDAHIDAYADPSNGILARFRMAAEPYRALFANPVHYAILEKLGPLRHFHPFSYVGADGYLKNVADLPGTESAYSDLTLVYEILANYGDAAHRLAELYLRRDAAGDRDLGLAVAEEAARYLTTSSLALGALVPATEPRQLADAREKYRSALDRLTDVQSHSLSPINALGFPDDFLLIVGGSSSDSYDTLLPHVQEYIEDASTELNGALSVFDNYNAQRDTYRDRLEDLMFSLEDRIAEIGDENSGLIREQTLRIVNANNQIRLNRTQINNKREELNIEFQLNEELKAANLSIASIKVNYLNQQRDLDNEIATIEAIQKGADTIAGFFEPGDPLTKAQKIAKGVNFLVQVGGAVAIADLEERKHELAGSEIMDLARADNLPLDARFRAFGKRNLLDLKRLAVESDIAANLARQEYNRMADLLSERERLSARRDALLAPASTPGNPEIDEGIASRYYADP